MVEDEDDDGKRDKAVKDDSGVTVAPEDDEVEEFFAILRRIQVAVKYFEKRNGKIDRELTPAAWSPSFKREDFEELKKEKQNQNTGLDLNSDPAAEQNVSDSS